MKVKEIPVNERPREKLELYGPSNLSTSDLLSILLASGLKGKNVTELSFELLSKVDSIKELASLNLEEICKIKGIGKVKKQALLKRFGSVAKIKQASLEELLSVDGINEELANKILNL